MRNAVCSFQAEPEEGVSGRRRAPEASVGAAFLLLWLLWYAGRTARAALREEGK